MLLVECMDNAEQDATMLKGRLHEIGSAGGEFSMASVGHVGTLLSFLTESFILALELHAM